MVDPPWPKRKGGIRTSRPNQGRVLDYPTMSIGDCFGLMDAVLFPNMSDSHCVFLWEVDEFLIDAEREMLVRGYKRHARLIWDKGNGVAPAFTVRFAHEYLVWWYKSPMRKIATGQRGRNTTLIREKGRQHSRKPDAAYDLIETLYPNESKIDVFSRQSRRGWSQYGNQCGFFDGRENQ